jgi:hypothetical protein
MDAWSADEVPVQLSRAQMCEHFMRVHKVRQALFVCHFVAQSILWLKSELLKGERKTALALLNCDVHSTDLQIGGHQFMEAHTVSYVCRNNYE